MAEVLIFVIERIGVLPDESNLYPELTCRRNLEYMGELFGLPRRRRTPRATELLSFFDLTDPGDHSLRGPVPGIEAASDHSRRPGP